MRDAEIWQLLGPPREGHEASVDELVPALDQLGREPVRARAGLLGRAHAHREHVDPRVRAAVIAALAGVTGIEGLRAVVAALDDDSIDVRAAAVDALIECARIGQSPRLLHALFHPRADVRARVVVRLPIELQWAGSYLREDPACADTVREWPLRVGLRLALDLHARGLASDTELCLALAHAEDGEVIEILRHSPRRSEAELADGDRWLAGQGPAPSGVDLLDRIAAAIDGCGIGRAIPPLVRHSRTAATGERMYLAIVLRLITHDRIADPLLTFAVRHDPNLLAAELIPLRWRKAAARLNAKAGGRSRNEPELVTALLGSDLARNPDGSLDLHTAASLAWLLPAPQHGRLIAALGIDAVIAALDRGDVPGFAALCGLPEPSVELRREHPELAWPTAIELLSAVAPEQRARLQAAALAVWAGQRSRILPLLDSLSPTELHACVVALLDELDGDAIELADKPSHRLAQLLGDAIEPDARFELVRALLGQARLRPLKAQVVQRLLREAEPSKLVLFVHATEVEQLIRLIAWLRDGVLLPVAVEQRLATLLREHRFEAVRTAAASLVESSIVLTERASLASLHRLTSAEIEAIATCSPAQLGAALGPALAGPSQGLAHALGRRRGHPSLEACVALLGAHDPIQAVAERFAECFDASFEPDLLASGVALWQGNPGLPPLGHAWLHKFEPHALAFGDWLVAEPDGLLAALDRCAGLRSPSLRIACFAATATVFALWRYRSPTRLANLALAELPSRLVERLDTELGVAAAKLLVSLHLAGQCPAELEGVRAQVLLLAPDLDRVTRHELYRWIKIDGLPERETAARADVVVRPDRLAELRTSEDLDQLTAACVGNHAAIVEEAILRLLEFGERGEIRLARVLADPNPPSRADLILNSVAMWTSLSCVDDVRALASDAKLDPNLRFRMALALAERGESDQVAVALAVAREPHHRDPSWLRIADWHRLERHTSTAVLADAWADSPHPHGYQHALEWLLARPASDESVIEPLRRFLRVGSHRPKYLRRRAAHRLADDPAAIPVLLEALLDPDNDAPPNHWLWQRSYDLRIELTDALVSATLLGGPEAAAERRVASLLDPKHGAGAAIQRLFGDCIDDTVRTQLARDSTSPQWRSTMLGGIAEIFAWGVRRGRELTGRLFRVQMTDKRQDFGYTLLSEDRIFVSPLPLFAGERHGREIVEALILHELGHHVHHGGEQAAVIWKRAQKRRLHGVLNLVADEHLERNLRSLRRDYGDRLKRLAAHAFLHAERDLEWTWLLDRLGAASFRILSTKPTTPAHRPGQVRIHRGDLMQALEAGGSSWARFARALRMGLGDRWGDAKVQAGLELFKGEFRHADMAELWRITQALAELFADELPLADVLGGQETLGDAEREGTVARRGIADEDVQQRVERILDPRDLGKSERLGGPSKLAINVGPDERFDRITEVQRVARDPDKHRAVTREVARHAQRMRVFLAELGLDLAPRRARLRGRSFDRTRIQAVVLRNDPRMLVARELEVRSDLFIGVLIDCSGSMGLRDLLATACRFAVLIAEAVRGLPGVDARFWGFTDSVIWDAGDADRCAVTSLQTGGGNNDAAALLHAAEAAAGSRRKSKLLVMISDGLPTQCSVAALRNLVVALGRKRIVCAQVAVRPLEEVCFPNYVLLADQPIELATVRFGELVSKLARQALGGKC